MDILFFSNGNTAVFKNEKQVPELQKKSWFRLFVEFLTDENVDPTQANIILPDGVKAKIFKTPNGYNWRVLS